MLIFLLTTLLSVTSSGGDLKNVDYYLRHPKVSKAAKDYYYKKFKAGDDDRTFSIFDSLRTKNNETRPFYIFLSSRIMENADGALGEASGAYAKEFVQANPKAFFLFFNANQLKDSGKYFKIWAEAVASEIRIDCEGSERVCLKKTINTMKLQVGKGQDLLHKRIVQFESLVGNYLP